MNRREKILVGAGIVIAVLLLGRAGIYGYFNKLEALEADIESQNKRLVETNTEVQRYKDAKFEWKQVGDHTLSTDENEAQTLLRGELFRLSSQAGLSQVDIRLLNARPMGRKTGIQVIRGSINGEGTLEQILRFMFDLQRQPYRVRASKLIFDRPRDRDAPQNQLLMRLDIDTIMLPKGDGRKLPRFQTVDLSAEQRDMVARTRYDNFEAYAGILDKNLFEPYVPPLPPPAKAVAQNPSSGASNVQPHSTLNWQPAAHANQYEILFSTESPNDLKVMTTLPSTSWRPPNLGHKQTYYWKVNTINAEGKKTEGDVWTFTTVDAVAAKDPPPPPPKPPADQELVLARIVSSPLSLQVVLEDPRNKTAPDKRVELGEELYGGTLILVHPKGAVSEKGNQRRFHALAEPLKNAKPLTRREHPEVFHEVLKLDQRTAGITQRSG